MSSSNIQGKIPEVPPLPIKQVIEKSVLYILKNGPSFEEKLKLNDASGQFAFLSLKDPHYAYYKCRLEAESSLKEPKTSGLPSENRLKQTRTQKPHELLFLTELPPISNYDLDIMKVTAVYVACNSDKHMEAFRKFMEHKGRRNQFAFMNKSHTLNGLFQSYTRQYKAIVDKQNNVPNTELSALIDAYMSCGKPEFFKKAYERASFEKRHKIKEKSREQDVKSKQLHYASIDWQDFSFVAKVKFDAIDEVSEMATPLLRESVVYRSLETRTKDLEFNMNTFTNDAAKPPASDDVAENGKFYSAEEPESAPLNVPKGMKIRAAGESRLKRKANEEKPPQSGSIRCPITGTLVPEGDFDMHLKTLLRDPRFKEQQENFMRKNFTYESNLTTDQVYENIKRLVTKPEQSETKRPRR